MSLMITSAFVALQTLIFQLFYAEQKYTILFVHFNLTQSSLHQSSVCIRFEMKHYHRLDTIQLHC